MVKQQLRVLCFINYSHLPSSGGEGATTTELTTKSTWLILLNYVHYHIKKAFNLTFQHLPLNSLDSKENMEETRELSQMILRDGKHNSFL